MKTVLKSIKLVSDVKMNLWKTENKIVLVKKDTMIIKGKNVTNVILLVNLVKMLKDVLLVLKDLEKLLTMILDFVFVNLISMKMLKEFVKPVPLNVINVLMLTPVLNVMMSIEL